MSQKPRSKEVYTQKKRVLVVGVGSYIGESFAKYAQERFDVDVVDSFKEWTSTPFEGYDSVLMAAGIAHQPQHDGNRDLYFAINRDLALAVAKKVKVSGVGQFIYLSSMAVYGMTEGAIDAGTEPSPRKNDYYGLSKYQAEKELTRLFHSGEEIDNVKSDTKSKTTMRNLDTGGELSAGLCIIRPPMVYGPGCPGKFTTLVKVSKVLPFIPKVNNQRSMIYIDNLSELLCIVVDKAVNGVLNPHNQEYMNTTWLLSAVQGHCRRIVPGMGWLVSCVKPLSAAVRTAFGSLYYTKNAAQMPFDDNYQQVSTEESVERSI